MTNIYDFYIHKLICKLSTTHISTHSKLLKDMNVKITVLDFCGKMKTQIKYFRDIVEDIYIVTDEFEDDIMNGYDIYYILDDIELLSKNNLYLRYRNALYMIFDGDKFIEYRYMK